MGTPSAAMANKGFLFLVLGVGILGGNFANEIMDMGGDRGGQHMIQEVTAANSYNDQSSPAKALDNNEETFWASQIGQSNGFLRFQIQAGKPEIKNVKSIEVTYYAKRSARLTRIYFRADKGRTLTMVDNSAYSPIGKLGDLKKETRYTFKLSDDVVFSKTTKHTGSSGRDSDCFNVFDDNRDMTEGQGTRIQEFMLFMEGAQTKLNGQPVLSVSELKYSNKLGCKGSVSMLLKTGK